MTVPALVPHRAVSEASLYDPKQMALIQRTMAKDATKDEFDVFVQMCRALRLDPLRKQVYCFIISPNDEKKRQMTLVTSIAGLRTIAARTGDYRPDSEAPVIHLLPWRVDRDSAEAGIRRKAAEESDLVVRRSFIFDQMQALDELYPIDPLNPEGIEKAVVRVFRFSHGEWHAITAEAYWTEYAPIKDEWAWDDGSNKRRPTGRKVLDTSGQWGKMPRTMLPKCAEGMALRKAWPDDLSNVYVEEELDRQKCIDLSPSEMAETGGQQERLARIGGASGLLVSWTGNATEALESVPVGDFADRLAAFIRENQDEPSAIISWRIRNREAFNRFWALHKADALELKKMIEAVTAPVAA